MLFSLSRGIVTNSLVRCFRAVGNYVVQGALRFGSPINRFIFDAMVDRCWEIGSGRFGARSTRQTLESPQASLLDIVSLFQVQQKSGRRY